MFTPNKESLQKYLLFWAFTEFRSNLYIKSKVKILYDPWNWLFNCWSHFFVLLCVCGRRLLAFTWGTLCYIIQHIGMSSLFGLSLNTVIWYPFQILIWINALVDYRHSLIKCNFTRKVVEFEFNFHIMNDLAISHRLNRAGLIIYKTISQI